MKSRLDWVILFIGTGILGLFGVASLYGFTEEGFEMAGIFVLVYLVLGIGGGIIWNRVANKYKD